MSPTVADTSIITNDPRLKRRIKQRLLESNARRMLAFCLVFIGFQATTLLLGYADIAFFYSDSGYKILYLGSFEFLFQLDLGGWSILRLSALGLALLFVPVFVLAMRGLIKSPRTQNTLLHTCLVLLTGM